jgi:AraC-like DNA-binding protein
MIPILGRPAPHLTYEGVLAIIIEGSDFGSVWHYHREIEIVLTETSHGERWIGDCCTPLEKGDLVILGESLPHHWHVPSSPTPQKVRAVVVQFPSDLIPACFLAKTDFAGMRKFLERVRYGLVVSGRTRLEAADLMRRMTELRGMERLAVLFQLLAVLSASTELEQITQQYLTEAADGLDPRMERLTKWINEELGQPIDFNTAAKVAGLSKRSFGRWFRDRTGMIFSQYLDEVRISHACVLLRNGQHRTITEIALDCGFSSAPPFNRSFKRLRGICPKAFRNNTFGLMSPEAEPVRRNIRALPSSLVPPRARRLQSEAG